MSKTALFYSNLPHRDISVDKLVSSQDLFSPIPEDWVVVVADIKNSTGAIGKGFHQEVNLIAVGSIIAALNLARKAKISIPFFFGGDGATLLVPPTMIESIMHALNEHRENTRKNFGFDLRVGQFPVPAVRVNPESLLISKVKRSDSYQIPIVLGTGLQEAERLLKETPSNSHPTPVADAALDLSGMECRWDPVKPPKPVFEVLCLLVAARNESLQPRIYQKVLKQIDEIYGVLEVRNPITAQKLKLTAGLNRIKTETLARLGRLAPGYLIRNWLLTMLGHWYIKYDQAGQKYVRRLVELSDTLVLDGRINTVISGTTHQRIQLLKFLQKMELDHEIIYGWHASEESIMSCYVRDRLDQHIHFVDGAGGGYTKAARMLKSKINEVNPRPSKHL